MRTSRSRGAYRFSHDDWMGYNLYNLFHRDLIPTSRRIKPVYAYSMTMLMYVIGWGAGVLTSILVLRESPYEQSHQKSSVNSDRFAFFFTIATVVIPISIAFFVMRRKRFSFRRDLCRTDKDSDSWQPYSRKYNILSEYIVGSSAQTMFLATLVVGAKIFSIRSYPSSSSPSSWTIATEAFNFCAAGIAEEICLMALPVYLLRNAGQSWKVIIPFLAILRISFHAYYGLAVIPAIFWPVFVILIYRSTKRLIGLIILHSANDMMNIGTFIPGGTNFALSVRLISIVALFVCFGIWQKMSRQRLENNTVYANWHSSIRSQKKEIS